MRIRQLFLVLALLATISANSQKLDSTEELEEQLKIATSNEKKIEAICALADHQFNVLFDKTCFDSLSFEAIKLASGTLDRELELKAINNYLNSITEEYYHESLQDIINDADRLALETEDEELKIKTWIAISNAYTNAYDKDGNSQHSNALTYSSNANNAALNKDHEIQVEASLSLGRSLVNNGEKLGAHTSLMNAKYLITQLESQLIKKYSEELNEELFDFYNQTTNYQKAIDAKKKLIQLLNENEDHYELKLNWHKSDIINIRHKLNPKGDFSNELEEILDYVERAKNKRLEDHALAIYRRNLIENKKFRRLKEKFTTTYKPAFEALKTGEAELQVTYYMTKAYFQEVENQLDSAIIYFDKAGIIASEAKFSHRLANYFHRYGQFFERNNLINEAMEKYRSSLNLSQNIEYKPFIRKSSLQMEKIYASLGMLDSAYIYSNIRMDAVQSPEYDNLKTKILHQEFQTNKKIEIYKKSEKEEQKKRETQLQYTGIIIVVLILSVLLILISSFAVPKWVVKMLGFFNILLIFEFITLLIDSNLHHRWHGNQLPIYIAKVILLSVLFPLHHLVESLVVRYMLNHNLFKRPKSSSVKEFLHNMWPFFKEEDQH